MNKKQIILELRKQGLTYDQIVEKTGCSKGTISYHCNPICKAKTRQRTKKYRSENSYIQKIDNFLSRKQKVQKIKSQSLNTKQVLKVKLEAFFRKRKSKTMSYVKPTISIQDVVNKFGDKPKCYLTGQELDIQSPRTYNFDHIIPVSKGGPNSLDNLGICTRDANTAKNDMLLDDFIELCKRVLLNQGYEIKAPGAGSEPA